MTEEEWLACDDPARMLSFLAVSYRNMSARKLRLFAVYCCRDILSPDTEPEVRHAVEVVEQYAEGLATEEEVNAAREAVFHLWLDYFGGAGPLLTTALGLISSAVDNPFRTAILGSQGAIEACEATDAYRRAARIQEIESLQAAWVRDIFPSPFRPKFVTRDWFRWNHGTALIIAHQMYESRDFGAMPILADALQDAGCDNEDILNHCRDASATHVRGCWVVDLVLGKE
jgi:hypothetical protein